MSELEEVVLTVDELEALRLADLEGHYQDEAAAKMGVSRQTFGRIVSAARRKAAEALVEGKALRIEGGKFEALTVRTFACVSCENRWETPYGGGRPAACPKCGGDQFTRVDGAEARRCRAAREQARGCPE